MDVYRRAANAAPTINARRSFAATPRSVACAPNRAIRLRLTLAAPSAASASAPMHATACAFRVRRVLRLLVMSAKRRPIVLRCFAPIREMDAAAASALVRVTAVCAPQALRALHIRANAAHASIHRSSEEHATWVSRAAITHSAIPVFASRAKAPRCAHAHAPTTLRAAKASVVTKAIASEAHPKASAASAVTPATAQPPAHVPNGGKHIFARYAVWQAPTVRRASSVAPSAQRQSARHRLPCWERHARRTTSAQPGFANLHPAFAHACATPTPRARRVLSVARRRTGFSPFVRQQPRPPHLAMVVAKSPQVHSAALRCGLARSR